MNPIDLQPIIQQGESISVEFKSDRGPLDNAELINTVVCLANAEGGVILLGVEDDGVVTGLHPNHRNSQPALLTAFIASRTVPPQTVSVTFQQVGDEPERWVAVLQVPLSLQPVATSDGRLLVRYLDPRGQPGCRPLYPNELAGWRADRGQADFTAQLLTEADWDALDPLEFARLRRMVEEYRGDTALAELSDDEIAGALGLARAVEGKVCPTVAGLLLLGKEAALRTYVPTHEVAFQVLQGTDVTVNEFRRWPLLRIFEWVMQAIDVRNEEQELMVDGFRVGVPRYDRRGLREAINNALIHRDYTRLGAIHIQLHDDHVLLSNPGGFVAGVNPDNLLVAAPHPRNPLLADAFKRTGLVERTGRGTSIIYRGQLRNGRLPPDYSRSTATTVTLTLDSRPADVDFVLPTIRADGALGRTPTVNELLALWQAWQEGQVDSQTLAPVLQRDPVYAAQVLTMLADAGLLVKAEDGYRLRAERRAGPQRIVEAVAVDPEAAILNHVREHGRITRREAVRLTGLEDEQVRYRLRKLVDQGMLELAGAGRGAYYRLPEMGKNGE